MKKLLFILLPLIVIGLAAAYLIYNKPHMNIRKADVDETISAAALLEAYEKDEQAANDQFLAKVIVVEGIVREKRVTEDSPLQIILETGNPLSTISCTMDHLTEHDGLQAIQSGDKIKLKGICTGMLMDVVLDRCVLIQ